MLAGFEVEVQLRLQRGGPGKDVDDAAHGVAAVERRARSLEYLDAAGLGHVDFVQRVVIEEAGGAGGDPVFEVEVQRLGGQGLADGGHVAFAVGHVHIDAGQLVHDLRRMGRSRFLDVLRARGIDRGGRLRLALFFSGAGDRDLAGVDLFLRGLQRGGRGGGKGGTGESQQSGAVLG